jgi:hypothetical protein
MEPAGASIFEKSLAVTKESAVNAIWLSIRKGGGVRHRRESPMPFPMDL